METYEVTLTFTEEVLGATPKEPEVYREWIAGQAALTDEQLAAELATVEKVEEKGWTGFHMLNGQPLFQAYIIKGFFKDACGMLRRVKESESSKIRAYKKIIDGLVFVDPKRIMLDLHGAAMSVCERPLRGQTARGERVSLARSDTCPAGTTLSFTVTVLDQVSEALLREWLDYGALRGLRQWRNSGKGTFVYTMEKA